MQMSWTDISSGLNRIWNVELWKTGDAQIYLSQVIIAITLIIVGVIVIRWIGSSLVKRALKSGHASQNTIYAFRKLFSFLAYVLIVLIALPVAGIPITIFAVLGGALAIGVGDRVNMLQYSTYSVISPEGCASILWKSADKAPLAAEAMGVTAERVKELDLINNLVEEPLGGAHRNYDAMARNLKTRLKRDLADLQALSIEDMLDQRYKRLMSFGYC